MLFMACLHARIPQLRSTQQQLLAAPSDNSQQATADKCCSAAAAAAVAAVLQGGGCHRSCSWPHHIPSSRTHTPQDGHRSKAHERNT
jgi:hypothetical protein